MTTSALIKELVKMKMLVDEDDDGVLDWVARAYIPANPSHPKARSV